MCPYLLVFLDVEVLFHVGDESEQNVESETPYQCPDLSYSTSLLILLMLTYIFQSRGGLIRYRKD